MPRELSKSGLLLIQSMKQSELEMFCAQCSYSIKQVLNLVQAQK